MIDQPKIIFLNHASFIIQFKNFKILNDPYLFGSAFNNGWNLIKEVNHNNYLKDLTHIFFSHEHPDHFSIPFLKSIPLQERKRISILYQKTFDNRVKNFCEKIGFKFVEIENLKKTKILDDFYITVGKVPFYDSWINFEIEKKNILNINDCVLEDTNIIFTIKKIIKNIDILFTQFSYANYIKEDMQKKRANDCLNKIKIQDKILKPSYIVPFASFIYFSHKENYFMNKNINTIETVYDYMTKNCKAIPIILRPNETWDLKEKKNDKSIDFWNTHYQNIPNLKLNVGNLKCNSEILYEKCIKYLNRLKKNNNNFLIYILYKLNFFTDIKIFVTDLNKYYLFNIIRGMKLYQDKDAKNEVDISLNSESLQFIFSFDYGFETLFINSRFVTNHGKFEKVLRNFIIGSLNNTGRYIKFSNTLKFLDVNLIKRAISFFRKKITY
ncbi:MBL fold metallo-hydrolase [Candidatus Pelagibacter sp.]|nr:MBL fold metallo-hydrolase [Candidatus Pelagibacter sp.]